MEGWAGLGAKGQQEREECQGREVQVRVDRCCHKLLPHLMGREPPTSLSNFCPALGTPNPVGLPGT